MMITINAVTMTNNITTITMATTILVTMTNKDTTMPTQAG